MAKMLPFPLERGTTPSNAVNNPFNNGGIPSKRFALGLTELPLQPCSSFICFVSQVNYKTDNV